MTFKNAPQARMRESCQGCTVTYRIRFTLIQSLFFLKSLDAALSLRCSLQDSTVKVTSRGLKTASPFHDRTADNDLHQISFMLGEDSLQVIPYPLFTVRHSSLRDSFTP